jgi:PAS domain S-box-containing protein
MRLTEIAGDTGGFELDLETNEVLLTDGARRIVGVSEQKEIRLGEVLEMCHPEDRKRLRESLRRTTENTEQTRGTYRLLKEGESRLLEVLTIPVTEDGDVTKLRGSINDTTDRREYQRKLKQIETLFEHAQDPLFLIDVGESFTVERVNPAYEENTDLSAESIRGKTLHEIFEDSGADMEAKYNECVEKREPLSYDEHLRIGGESTHWETKIAPVVLDGTVEYIVGSTRDITAQRERERELREYETIIHALTDAVYVLDEDGRFTYVNDEFAELTGYDRNTVLGNTPSLIKDEEATEQAEENLGRLLSDDGPDKVTFEVRINPKDGDAIICEDHMGVLPYEGDRFEGSVGTLRDITERKRREHELEKTRELMSEMEKLAGVGAWEYDPEEGDLFLTDGTYTIYGLEPDADLTPEEAFGYYQPEDRELLRECFEDCIETGEPYEVDARLVTEDGEQKRVTVRGNLVEDTPDSGYAVRGYIQDTTERTEQRRKLERKNERLSEFVSIVSHDLRNPLTVAEGRVEMAKEDCDSDHLDHALDAIVRGEELISDLLTLAREGQEVSETETVELAEVAQECWGKVETGEANIEVETDRTVQADRTRLKQLLENLYRNATEHGGEDVTVRVGDIEGGFYVEDDGPGIPEGEHDSVFEAGYTTVESGTGFGLRIVEQVAEAHGWDIRATDGTEGGARFEITGVEDDRRSHLPP